MAQGTANPTRFSYLTSQRFWLTLLAGIGTVVLAAIFAPPAAQIAIVGILAALGVAVLVSREGEEPPTSRQPETSDLLGLSLAIAKDDAALEHHRSLAHSLASVVRNSDPLFRSLALKRTASLSEQAEQLGSGTLVFEDTETWRVVYEELLRSPGLHLYRSAALVESPAYWQDEPGRQSMKLNLEMQDSERLSIERTVIIADQLWPANQQFPEESLHTWIDDQQRHGIWMRLVRLSALAGEPDLQADFGIYGSRAVGVQHLNLHAKTARYVLTFGMEAVKQAEDRWERLAVYATPYAEILDRAQS